MAGVVKKSFDSPDERRTPDKTEVEVVDLGSVKAARMTLQPGWRWSECIKPIVGTESCQIHHEGMARRDTCMCATRTARRSTSAQATPT